MRARRHLLVGITALLPVVAAHTRVAEVPVRLSDTGFDARDSRLAFAPQYPLWSDGATKRRWVSLPDGGAIDATDPDAWHFPDGTKFWKEFSIGGRKVETRMLWKHNGEWTFASYVWNDAQTEAVLAPAEGLTTGVEVAPGRRHRIPSIDDCRACHVTRRVEVLGFTALQLSDDRDPHALHAEPLQPGMVTLSQLMATGRLSNAPAHWVTHPPRIQAPDPETRAILGYLSTNCGSCHNAEGGVPSVDLKLKAYTSSTTHATQTTHLTYPTHLMLSRMMSRRPSSQMPPLGTQVVDAEAIARLRRWQSKVSAGLTTFAKAPVVRRSFSAGGRPAPLQPLAISPSRHLAISPSRHLPIWELRNSDKIPPCLSSTTPSSSAPATMD